MENLISRFTKIIDRPDGSQVRMVATACFGAGLRRSIDFYVHRRPTKDDPWELCCNRPHPDWRSMSVDEYVERGRSPMLRAVSIGEILSVTSMIGTPFNAASDKYQAA